MTPNTLAIVQARMSSTRFPAKVLEPLLGMPLIIFMLERVKRAACVDELMVATSLDVTDDPLAEVVGRHGIRCFRGNLGDVLDRFYRAACTLKPQRVVRLTGDCPMIDADMVDLVVDAHQESGAAYSANVDPRTFPQGLDVECFTLSALEHAWREAQTPFEREHVTPFIRNHPELFRRVSVRGLSDMSALRWTVDYPADLHLLREMLRRRGARTPLDFDRFDMYRVIEADPDLITWNKPALTNVEPGPVAAADPIQRQPQRAQTVPSVPLGTQAFGRRKI